MEYSLEYGFLRLSQSTRQRLNIPVMVVTLGENAIMGGWGAPSVSQGTLILTPSRGLMKQKLIFLKDNTLRWM